jgi:SAM-dependent methyltransferase
MSETSDDGASPQYGQSYIGWKGWAPGKFAKLSRTQTIYFDAELRKARTRFAEGANVLEIGFGNGAFLAYARRRGWRPVGIEINPELVATARRSGFEAVCGEGLAQFADDHFDLVTAFDVLEHIAQDRIAGFLEDVRRVLKPGGIFLARFPNGDSPFGLVCQNGDVTHVSVIGSGKAGYFARAAGLQLVCIGGEARPILGGRLLRGLAGAPIRALTNFIVRHVVYQGRKVAFCSENLVMVLRADKAQPG